MVHQDQGGQDEVVIGIAARIEVSEMGGHNVLTKGVLLRPSSARVGIGDPGGAAALKPEARDIDRNRPRRHRETPIRPDDSLLMEI